MAKGYACNNVKGDLESVTGDDADVGRDEVTELDLDNVTADQFLRVDVQLLSIPDYQGELSMKVVVMMMMTMMTATMII